MNTNLQSKRAKDSRAQLSQRDTWSYVTDKALVIFFFVFHPEVLYKYNTPVVRTGILKFQNTSPAAQLTSKTTQTTRIKDVIKFLFK